MKLKDSWMGLPVTVLATGQTGKVIDQRAYMCHVLFNVVPGISTGWDVGAWYDIWELRAGHRPLHNLHPIQSYV